MSSETNYISSSKNIQNSVTIVYQYFENFFPKILNTLAIYFSLFSRSPFNKSILSNYEEAFYN